MFQEILGDPGQVSGQAITTMTAAKNAAVAAVVAFSVLYITAYRRVGSDDFVFIDWLVANRNRWLNGIVTLVLLSVLTTLIPDLGAIANIFGFNLNASVPLSLGLALAAFLASTTKAIDPISEDDIQED